MGVLSAEDFRSNMTEIRPTIMVCGNLSDNYLNLQTTVQKTACRPVHMLYCGERYVS